MTARRRLVLASFAAIVASHAMCGTAWGEPDAGVPDAAPVPSDAGVSDAMPAPPLVAPLQPGGSYLHLRSTAHVKTSGGSELDVAPGYYVDEPSWTKLDAEFKRLQDLETRQGTENKTLKKAMSSWEPGWRTLALTFASGMMVGAYLAHKL